MGLKQQKASAPGPRPALMPFCLFAAFIAASHEFVIYIF